MIHVIHHTVLATSCTTSCTGARFAASSTAECTGARQVIHHIVYWCSLRHPPHVKPSFVDWNVTRVTYSSGPVARRAVRRAAAAAVIRTVRPAGRRARRRARPRHRHHLHHLLPLLSQDLPRRARGRRRGALLHGLLPRPAALGRHHRGQVPSSWFPGIPVSLSLPRHRYPGTLLSRYHDGAYYDSTQHRHFAAELLLFETGT